LAQPIPIFALESVIELRRLMVDALAGAAIGDQRKRWGRARWAPKALAERIIHNIAHSQVPLSSAALGLPQEFIIYYEGGSHTDEHTYA
jgi:uncharacterized heparinase superfamily protein